MFDLAALGSAVEAHGHVARVVIAEVAGSAPREVGASMLVWDGGQSGTIGGGTLEYEAARHAFARSGATRHALGPELGQCCGGSVTLWTEQFNAAAVTAITGPVYARGPGDCPLSVHRVLDKARAQGHLPDTQLQQGWLIEPLAQDRTPLWIWGAGHVGRALVTILQDLPEFEITWIDTAPDRFPQTVPDGVTPLPTPDPARLAAHAPQEAMHLVLTYSHELDLALCHTLLARGFAFAGLIGSATKWARFRKRLRRLGHPDARIDGICCPIGQKSLGKSPASIAIGVAAQLLSQKQNRDGTRWETPFSASRA
ncbi:xanthine dehydrogenase accessory protein XdhC [Pseudoprimorskyibacter insulae]|uniref:Xanthine dehydrogenase subunit A n=1 Tax=Pseudoprimorskyibacter insulae TaxID=1695997 RepID=A0A2R8AVT0_9RHOB|nr:xanthine dehydrogenase accessory protein XdhC [Pseudoprimorskyibacter insulae]SPF80014.1 hypothetical protein PRI8871_01816 [Pseudoprimorskyibacter insulae]